MQLSFYFASHSQINNSQLCNNQKYDSAFPTNLMKQVADFPQCTATGLKRTCMIGTDLKC